jgi:hypothetical protein
VEDEMGQLLRKPLLRCLGCLGIMVLCWTAGAYASLLVSRTPEQLGAGSDAVVLGKVESSKSYWNERHTKVFTRVHIAVERTYKGAGMAAIDLVQLGGTIGTMKVTAHGAPTWRIGEEVLIFAERDGAGAYRVAGFSQGKFRVIRDAETGEASVLAPRVSGAQILGAPAGLKESAGGPGVPLDEFIEHAIGHAPRQGVAR